MHFLTRVIFLIIFLNTLNIANVDIPSNRCALIVASLSDKSAVKRYINTEIEEKKYVTIYRSANNRYQVALGFLKDDEQSNIVKAWKKKGKIPQDAYCTKGSRFIEEIALDTDTSRTESHNKYKDTVYAGFDYEVAGDSVYLDVDLRNYYKRYTRGGLSVSFPQLVDGSDVRILSTKGYEKVNKYPSKSQIYNKERGFKMSADYLLVEGWTDHWNDSSPKSFRLKIDIGHLSDLIVNIRGVVRDNYFTVSIPDSGPKDQQGYHSKRIVINLKKSLERNKNSISSSYVNAYKGAECSDSNKPILACAPDEKNKRAFAMCAVTMGGCHYAVNLVEDRKERYLASQACSAISAELLEQKYTLDDMLGTFFLDSMGELAKDQLESDNIFAQGFGLILAVGTAAGKLAQLEQCQVNARKHCTKKYDDWVKSCK